MTPNRHRPDQTLSFASGLCVNLVYPLTLVAAGIIVTVPGVRADSVAGATYPASAPVTCDWTQEGDVITVTLGNTGADSIEGACIVDFSEEEPEPLECRTDGQVILGLLPEITPGSVVPGRFTARWHLPAFEQSAVLVYRSASATSRYFHWRAAGPTAMFGLIEDDCCVLRGDVNFDQAPVIDVSDMIYLLDFMFYGGPPPVCFDAADVDGSGTTPIDIGDVVYLTDFMFGNGPAPAPCVSE